MISSLLLKEIFDNLLTILYLCLQIKFTMKKLLAIAFIGSLVLTSCAKKEQPTESNTMLEEPEVATIDTLNAPAATAVVPATTDSTMTK